MINPIPKSIRSKITKFDGEHLKYDQQHLESGNRDPFGKFTLSLFFPPCCIVSMAHLYKEAATFSLPVDCFASFQGPFVFTDSAFHTCCSQLKWPSPPSFTNTMALHLFCWYRYNQSEEDCKQGTIIDVFFKWIASMIFDSSHLVCLAPAAGSLQEGSSWAQGQVHLSGRSSRGGAGQEGRPAAQWCKTITHWLSTRTSQDSASMMTAEKKVNSTMSCWFSGCSHLKARSAGPHNTQAALQ